MEANRKSTKTATSTNRSMWLNTSGQRSRQPDTNEGITMTEKQAEGIAAYEAHNGNMTAAAKSLGISAPALRKRIMQVRPDLIGSGFTSPNTEVSTVDGGFSLSGRTVLAAKPTDIWKARFFALKPGMGYTTEHLADQWGNSMDTVKSKAKRFKALRYVEDAERPGCYMACIVHPETKGN